MPPQKIEPPAAKRSILNFTVILLLIVLILILSSVVYYFFVKNTVTPVVENTQVENSQQILPEKVEIQTDQLPPELIAALAEEFQKYPNYGDDFVVFSITHKDPFDASGYVGNQVFAFNKKTSRIYVVGGEGESWGINGKEGTIGIFYGSGIEEVYKYNSATDKFEDTLPPNHYGI